MLHERLNAYEGPRRTPAPPAAQIVASIVCVGCALCCIGNYMTCTLYGFETDTIGFLRIGACLLVLPASMTLICLNHVEYRAFERVRHDPRTQIIDNLRIIGVLSASTAVGGVALFAFVAATRIRATTRVRSCSIARCSPDDLHDECSCGAIKYAAFQLRTAVDIWNSDTRSLFRSCRADAGTDGWQHYPILMLLLVSNKLRLGRDFLPTNIALHRILHRHDSGNHHGLRAP